MKNLYDLIQVIEVYTGYLKKYGVKLNKEGFPILKRECFLDEWPALVVPYDYRNSKIVVNPRRTVLCLYTSDARIYPRLEKILDDLCEYKRFMGAVASDITITQNMENDWQNLIMLANQLYLAILAANGIKVLGNLRTGSQGSLPNLKSTPCNVMWAAGFLGCEKDDMSDMRFISSVMFVRPSKMLLYGKEDENATEKLNTMGVDFRYYHDYHKSSKSKKYL